MLKTPPVTDWPLPDRCLISRRRLLTTVHRAHVQLKRPDCVVGEVTALLSGCLGNLVYEVAEVPEGDVF